MNNREQFMQRAIELAEESVEQGGGPFGAVIVRNGEIIAEGCNRVTLDSDPTAHAEMVAIRIAAGKLGDFNLSDCVIYSSCEPCPMCLSAIYWSRIPEVYFGADRTDAEEAGFDDSHIYRQLQLKPEDRDIQMIQLSAAAARGVFKKWNDTSDKTRY